MGWYATSMALKYGTCSYGTVSQSLKGEAQPHRTLAVALQEVEREIASELWSPHPRLRRSVNSRLAYWRKRSR